MSQRAVVSTQELPYGSATDEELNIGIAYAEKEHGRGIDKELLRLMVNTVMRRRQRRTILPFLAATVVREIIPQHDKERTPKVEAYKSGIMKIMNIRRVRQQKADAIKRAQGLIIPPRPTAVEHPEDPRRKGQLLLL